MIITAKYCKTISMIDKNQMYIWDNKTNMLGVAGARNNDWGMTWGPGPWDKGALKGWAGIVRSSVSPESRQGFKAGSEQSRDKKM